MGKVDLISHSFKLITRLLFQFWWLIGCGKLRNSFHLCSVLEVSYMSSLKSWETLVSLLTWRSISIPVETGKILGYGHNIDLFKKRTINLINSCHSLQSLHYGLSYLKIASKSGCFVFVFYELDLPQHILLEQFKTDKTLKKKLL